MKRQFDSGNPKPTFKEIIKGVCSDFLNLIAYSWKVLIWVGLIILVILVISGLRFFGWI